ncbi:ABC transporter ATP-binding protein [Sulfidibacter corallicola]|uniref:ABC transporter ATP-binding protein n=1 Tax=Sulfidibacter corallicola TaxID=2818388 RepID=A0A8A4TNM3_SULCO|nr:ABC transporter ATP-binding protein [Sulfidibacter corallicola]QTD51150.1 ABC transporter ATP-binding protein [Sulfidibacter corallicola]
MNATPLDQHVWPVHRLDEAMTALAATTGWRIETPKSSPPPAPHDLTDRRLDLHLQRQAAALGLEAERINTTYGQVRNMMAASGPSLLAFNRDGRPRFLALLEGGRRKARLLSPEGQVVKVAYRDVVALFAEKLEAPIAAETDRLLDRAGLSGRVRAKTRISLMEQNLSGFGVNLCWLLRLPTRAPLPRRIRDAGLTRRLFAFLGCHLLQYLIIIQAWKMIGASSLGGDLTPQGLVPWGLLLFSQVPLGMATFWFQGHFNIGAAQLLKQYLLQGSLNLDLDRVKRQGPGHILARVLESDALESLVLNGGLTSLMAIADFAITFWVLSKGLAAPYTLGAALIWLVAALILVARYYRRCRDWTRSRLAQSHALTERMLGHRTRLAQEDPDHYHDGEDAGLADGFRKAQAMDRVSVLMRVILTRGWLVIGFAALIPGMAAGPSAATATAIALGGILLGGRAFANLHSGFSSLVLAWISWQEVRPLLQDPHPNSGSAVPDPRALQQQNQFGVSPTNEEKRQVVLQGSNLRFRHDRQGSDVIRGVDIRVRYRDRIVLEGRSGSGKSTLAALLTGLRKPESGLMMLHGLDPASWGGPAWRRRVAMVSQFHENHVFTGTLAFNLLMGRNWPANQEDEHEAWQVCQELGLGPLLASMPAGLKQMVGDTGWQLSHGERARVYIARALLQEPDLLILDESFASLDPESLQTALACVARRVPTVMIIAHP